MNVLPNFSSFLTRAQKLRWIACAVSIAGLGTNLAEQKNWEVPLGGNAYLTSRAESAPDRLERDGIRNWQDSNSVFCAYFRANQAGKIRMSLRLEVPEGSSEIAVRAAGKTFRPKIEGSDTQIVPLGEIKVESPGYVKVEFKGVQKTGKEFARISDVILSSETEGMDLAFVKEPGGNRFYWGRRGPSVHLGYKSPTDKTIEYFHSEITVPKGADPIGSYFMANGFGEGYFGIQVNSPTERRVLFSVWSPFHTDNPKDIPEEDRIVLLKKGKDVRVGEFGNEGSGGQSFLIYPWKAGNTYRFLNNTRPHKNGSTIYTAWFLAPEEKTWRLIASFKRPKTNKHLTGMHSFLENFSDRNGYFGRMSYHGNQWVRDIDGKWHEVTETRFTGDDIARRTYRMDYAGGVKDGRFFMRNGGYFDEHVKLNSEFSRPANPRAEPKINFGALE